MNKGTAIDLGLNEAYNDLFSTQEDRDNAQRSYVTDLPAAEISDFPNHPFKVRMDQSMVELADSVKQYGVLVPSLVRPMPDGSYQMVSGHRRKRAAELAGLPTVPCIIRELTDDEAIIVMVDSNLQREQILPSEKAVAYKMKLEAMKRQGMRTDLTFGPLGQKSAINTRDTLATEVPDSSRQIQRYIRLTNLIPELLDMVDNSVLKEAGKLQMALRPAVELSYLPEAEQTALLEVMEGEIRTPSHAQAIKMRSFSEHGKLNPDVILSIMQEEKPNQVEQFKIPRERIDKFFKPGTPAQKIEDTIVKALELYRKRQRRWSDEPYAQGKVCPFAATVCLPLSPSHTLSPKPAVPAEKKGFVYPFSAGKNLWRTARKKTEHRYCRTSWRAMRIFCA